MEANRLSDNIFTEEILAETDIGGTTATSTYVDMAKTRQALFVGMVNTFDATDLPLDTCKLVQATSAAGAGKKDITGKTLAFTAADTQGAIDLDASELDTDNDFTFAAIEFTEAGNTGPDFVQALITEAGKRQKFANVGAYDLTQQ